MRILKLILVFFSSFLFSQESLNVDSLKKLISQTQNDSVKLIVYERITEFCEINEVEQYAAAAVVLANKLLHDMKVNTNFVLERKEAILNNRGFAAQQLSDITNALNYYYEALKIAEKLKHLEKQTVVLLNISSLFRLQEDFEKALEVCTRTYDMIKNTNLKRLKSILLNDIGVCYSSVLDNKNAYKYFIEALNIQSELGDSIDIATTYLNIGRELKSMNKFEEARNYMQLSMGIRERINDHYGVAQALLHLATVQGDLNKIDLALKNGLKALELFRKLGQEVEQIQCYDVLGRIYYMKGMYKESADLLRKYYEEKEKVTNEAKQKAAFRKDLQYQYDKKANQIRAEQEKQELIAKEEKRQHQIIIASVSVGLAMVFVFAFFVFRAYRQKQKANIIITQQKLEVEQQKELVDHKNKEITDSIHYAHRIQTALITNERYIEKELNKLQNKKHEKEIN